MAAARASKSSWSTRRSASGGKPEKFRAHDFSTACYAWNTAVSGCGGHDAMRTPADSSSAKARMSQSRTASARA